MRSHYRQSRLYGCCSLPLALTLWSAILQNRSMMSRSLLYFDRPRRKTDQSFPLCGFREALGPSSIRRVPRKAQAGRDSLQVGACCALLPSERENSPRRGGGVVRTYRDGGVCFSSPPTCHPLPLEQRIGGLGLFQGGARLRFAVVVIYAPTPASLGVRRRESRGASCSLIGLLTNSSIVCGVGGSTRHYSTCSCLLFEKLRLVSYVHICPSTQTDDHFILALKYIYVCMYTQLIILFISQSMHSQGSVPPEPEQSVPRRSQST